MAAQQTAAKPRPRVVTRLRQFVVRLEQPGLYTRLLSASLRLSEREGRHIHMTEIAREGIENRVEEIEQELGE